MYPLIYGETRVLKDERVGIEDAMRWAGKGEVVPTPAPFKEDEKLDHYLRQDIADYWTDKYQWLPANIAFQDRERVKFTSYINNLHPRRYPEIYETIEKLIEKALPLWDHCLVPRKSSEPIPSGCYQPRQSRFVHPENPE